MKSKWIIDLPGYERYAFGEDGNLYRLPFQAKCGKNYGLKLVKERDGKRWKLNQRWWSRDQLRPHLKITDNPIELTKVDKLPYE